MFRGTLVLNAVIAVASLSASSAEAAHHEILGRWNLTVGEAPNAGPSWLGVEWKDGKHVGRFLSTAGGVGDIGEVQFDNPTITFDAANRKWTGKLEGDRIEGTNVDGSGNKTPWVGIRSKYKTDVAGTWTVKNNRGRESKLVFEQAGDKVTGRRGRGRAGAFDVKVDGDTVEFDLAAGGNREARHVKAEVKGDVMQGTVGGAGRDFVAERQREWGEPVELFNGENLDGWKPLGNPDHFKWKVIDGVMTNTGDNGSANIVSEKEFRDFKLHVEFRVPPQGNSGVYLRGRHEIQVADSFGKDKPGPGDCGSMYSRIIASTNASKPTSEWQTFDVKFVGRYVTVEHNGVTIIDNQELEGITGGAMDSRENDPGPIYLQGDHGHIEYRKVTLWPAK